MNPAVRVMVGVLRDTQGRVLINQRPAGKMQAGRWEFPGGKLDHGESPEPCLRRELREELGIVAGPMRRLIQIRHHYPSFSVLLDVREVLNFGGMPQSRENQVLKWVRPDDLPAEDILEADCAIVQALRLPDRCLVTPDPGTMSRAAFLDGLRLSMDDGITLVLLRARTLPSPEYLVLARDVLAICRRQKVRLLLNADPSTLREVDADGIHLSSARLRSVHRRPLPESAWVSASCHTAADLEKARELAIDFALLSPVYPTATHPEQCGIGWAGFRKLALNASMPVYALGGLSPAEIERARDCGGHGIAAIRGLWRSSGC